MKIQSYYNPANHTDKTNSPHVLLSIEPHYLFVSNLLFLAHIGCLDNSQCDMKRVHSIWSSDDERREFDVNA